MSGVLTAVQRVRISGVDADPATARSQLGSLLGNAELRPRGLPPAAVLCVRRVADPLPGRIELDSTQARPPPEWERAFVDTLTRLLERAARPAREAVPANAEAVLFSDRSELLACLARDARDGVAWTRWWWRSLWPAAPPGGDPVVASWLATPAHVPGALALLAARGEAVSFVGALPLAAAAQLAQRVATGYGAVALERALAPLTSPTAASAARSVSTASQARGEASTAAPVAPWTAIVPEANAQPLAPAREALLGVALALRRAPATAGTGAFATAVAAWLEQPTSGAAQVASPRATKERRPIGADTAARTPSHPARTRAGRPPTRRAAATTAEQAAETAPRSEEATSSAPAPAAGPAPVAPPHATPRKPHRSAQDVGGPDGTPTIAATQDAAIAASPLSPAVIAATVARAEPAIADAFAPARADRLVTPSQARAGDAEPLDEPWEAPAIGIETELGGAFYLLNLFLYLGLYGDFTQPLARGLALDPWTCIALVARRLLGPGNRRDPLWQVLERLAAPSGFHPPRAWRTPRDWLEPFDTEGEWRWSAAGGTLRLQHPDGFAVVAVPRTGEPAQAQLTRELRRLRIAPALRRASLRREPAQPLARWVARLSAYAEARLRVALELPLDTLLRRRARVFVTASHVDVVLSLAELPLEVRFAGLDRTPGWIPAAGRFVAFHFE